MRVKKYLPSIITLSNLFLGFLSILYIQKGEFAFACHLILIAALLDSFDGKLARKIGVVSSFGKEIDSLADVVSFCLSPSFLVFNILFYSNISTYDAELFFIYLALISSFPLLMGVKHLLCDLTLYMSCFLKFLATENEQRVILQLVLKRLILLECEMTIYTKHHIFSQQLLAIDGP